MVQHFKLVNLDKKEYVCPWSVGALAQLWEWCINSQTGIFAFLLRHKANRVFPKSDKHYSTEGRWAGDRVVLVGSYEMADFENNKLWASLETAYTDITQELDKDYKDFSMDDQD